MLTWIIVSKLARLKLFQLLISKYRVKRLESSLVETSSVFSCCILNFKLLFVFCSSSGSNPNSKELNTNDEMGRNLRKPVPLHLNNNNENSSVTRSLSNAKLLADDSLKQPLQVSVSRSPSACWHANWMCGQNSIQRCMLPWRVEGA